MAGYDLVTPLLEMATSLDRGEKIEPFRIALLMRSAAHEIQGAEQIFSEIVIDLNQVRMERDQAARNCRETNRLYATWRSRADKAEAELSVARQAHGSAQHQAEKDAS